MKYDAFISYRHSPLDVFVAENLHKKLEAFRLPKSIAKQRGKDAKKKIERVFRDRDELPLATNLADPITDALENSEFLIVICSPRLPQSLWCKKEIETFIAMHGRERVLAVLIEGEPDESFPEELLYRTCEITKEDGTVEVIKEPVEPLAADVRGKTKKEVLKKMDEELLRLAAAMFECAYDDLKQRHKEQKMKKMLTMSLAASAFFLVFGAVSTTMAVRIHSQKEQIQEQSEEIKAQKEEIEVQYQQALYNQSLSMAEKSMDLLAEGDRLEAMKVALDALGETEDGTPMPVTAEAQYVLAQSSYVYEDGENYEPIYLFKHNANLTLIQVSPNGQYMMAVDKYGNVCVWKISENKKIAQFLSEDLSSATEEDCFFLNDTQILYDNEDGFAIFDIDKQENVYTYEDEYYFVKGKADINNRWFAVVVDDFRQQSLLIYDSQNYEQLFSYLIPEGKQVSSAMSFELENNRLIFAIEPDYISDESGSTVMIMNLETGEVTEGIKLEYSVVEQMTIVEDVLYAGVRQSSEDAFPEGDIDLNIPYKSIIYAVNINTMTKKWEYHYDYGMIHDFQINEADYSRHIMLAFYSEAHIVNMDTGVMEHEFAYGGEIVSTFYYTNSDRFVIVTRDGEYHIINATSGNDIVIMSYFQANSDNFKQVLLTEKGFVSLPHSAYDVTYYEFAEGPEFEVLCEFEKDISEVCVNKSENKAVVVSRYYSEEGCTISLVDLETGIVLKEIVKDTTSVYADIIGEDDKLFFVLTQDVLELYSIEDGSLQIEYELQESVFANYISAGADGKSIIIREYNDFWNINIKDGSYNYLEIDNTNNRVVVANINNEFNVYAVADKSENAVLLYRLGEEEPYLRLDAVASLVKEVLFADNNRYLFVYYVDGTAALFDLESGACVREYESLGNYLYGFDVIGEGETYLLTTSDGGYLFNEDFEIIANIPECAAIMFQNQHFIGIDDKILYTGPIYNVEQLIQKATEILNELQ